MDYTRTVATISKFDPNEISVARWAEIYAAIYHATCDACGHSDQGWFYLRRPVNPWPRRTLCPDCYHAEVVSKRVARMQDSAEKCVDAFIGTCSHGVRAGQHCHDCRMDDYWAEELG